MQAFSLNLPLLKIFFKLLLKGHMPYFKKKKKVAQQYFFHFSVSSVMCWFWFPQGLFGLAWRFCAIWKQDFHGQGDILQAIAGMQPELH